MSSFMLTEVSVFNAAAWYFGVEAETKDSDLHV